MKIKATFPKRRDGGYGSVTIVVDGKPVALAIGADGVVDVPDEHAARLINLGNFVSADGSKPKVEEKQEEMLITNGDETIDLMALDKDELLTMARDVMGLDVNGRNSAQTLREAILAHVNGQ